MQLYIERTKVGDEADIGFGVRVGLDVGEHEFFVVENDSVYGGTGGEGGRGETGCGHAG